MIFCVDFGLILIFMESNSVNGFWFEFWTSVRLLQYIECENGKNKMNKMKNEAFQYCLHLWANYFVFSFVEFLIPKYSKDILKYLYMCSRGISVLNN